MDALVDIESLMGTAGHPFILQVQTFNSRRTEISCPDSVSNLVETFNPRQNE